MPTIRLDNKDIFLRPQKIQEMLRPLFATKHSGPACHYRPGKGSSLIFAAHQGSPPDNFLNWRFNVFVRGFLGGYYEIWRPTDFEKLNTYYLDRAYLTVYYGSEEYLSIHCDPEEPEDKVKRIHFYKRIPHIHIHKAESPIPKSHIAIGHGFIDHILSSDDYLFDAMGYSIELICDEVLRRC